MRESDKVLRVAEARTKDVGRGIARIDPAVLEALALEEGDTIVVAGTRETVAVVAPPLPEDRNRGVIRIDGNLRRNAGVGIDDKVGVRKVEPKSARRVVLAPTESLRIMGGEEYLAQILAGRVVTRGDIVQVRVMGRPIDLAVVSTNPAADAVLVERGTEIKVSQTLAMRVAEQFFQSWLSGQTVETALRAIRMDFLRQGNIFGLVYTPYCWSELKIEKQ